MSDAGRRRNRKWRHGAEQSGSKPVSQVQASEGKGLRSNKNEGPSLEGGFYSRVSVDFLPKKKDDDGQKVDASSIRRRLLEEEVIMRVFLLVFFRRLSQDIHTLRNNGAAEDAVTEETTAYAFFPLASAVGESTHARKSS